MARFLFIVIAFIIAFQTQAFAQQPQQEDETPKTKLEAITLKDGVLLVREFSDTGLRLEQFVTILALKVYEPGKEQTAVRGLSVDIQTVGPLSHTRTAFVDIDEIRSLSDALGYMIETGNSWVGTQRDYTEVVYLTKGDLRIGFYQKGKGITAFITVGQALPESTFISLKTLPFVKDAVDKSLEILES